MEQPALANEEACPTVREKFGAEDAGVLAVAAEAAIVTSRGTLASEEDATWMPDDEYGPQTTMDVGNSRHVLSNRKWRPTFFPRPVSPPTYPRLRARNRSFLEMHRGATGRHPARGLGVKCYLVSARSTMRRILAAAAVKQWRSKVVESLSGRQFAVGVAQGAKYMGLHCKLSH